MPARHARARRARGLLGARIIDLHGANATESRSGALPERASSISRRTDRRGESVTPNCRVAFARETSDSRRLRDDGRCPVLDLRAGSDCDLAVLSACETKREPRFGARVFSLCRAFPGAFPAHAGLAGRSQRVDRRSDRNFSPASLLAARGSSRLPALSARRNSFADPRWAEPYYCAPFVLPCVREVRFVRHMTEARGRRPLRGFITRRPGRRTPRSARRRRTINGRHRCALRPWFGITRGTAVNAAEVLLLTTSSGRTRHPELTRPHLPFMASRPLVPTPRSSSRRSASTETNTVSAGLTTSASSRARLRCGTCGRNQSDLQLLRLQIEPRYPSLLRPQTVNRRLICSRVETGLPSALYLTRASWLDPTTPRSTPLAPNDDFDPVEHSGGSRVW